MNTLKFDQFKNIYMITIQPKGFAFPYTFKINTFESALFVIAQITEQYNIKITI